MSADREFPKYLMKINDEEQFMTFLDACKTYVQGNVPVEFGRYVLNEDFRVRRLTEEDRHMILQVRWGV